MKRKRRIILGVTILVMTLMAIYANNSIKVSKKKPSIDDIPQQVEQKILSLELTNYANDGSKKWLLKGDSADILAEVVNLTNIDMETYDEPKITVEAIEGAYNRVKKEISLFKDVKIVTSDGMVLTTDYLNWDGDTDTVTTDRCVKIVRSDVTAYGKGALAMPQMKKMILNKNVLVKLAKNVMRDMDMGLEEEAQAEAKEPPPKAIITCKGPLEIDYENNIATFRNDVLVNDRKGKIYSDVMDAFLDPVTKDIVKVIAVGDVLVVRPNGDATHSQKAIYTTADQKIVLIGQPKIYIRSKESIGRIDSQFEAM